MFIAALFTIVKIWTVYSTGNYTFKFSEKNLKKNIYIYIYN